MLTMRFEQRWLKLRFHFMGKCKPALCEKSIQKATVSKGLVKVTMPRWVPVKFKLASSYLCQTNFMSYSLHPNLMSYLFGSPKFDVIFVSDKFDAKKIILFDKPSFIVLVDCTRPSHRHQGVSPYPAKAISTTFQVHIWQI